MYVHAHPPMFDLQAGQEGTRQLQEAGRTDGKSLGSEVEVVLPTSWWRKKLGDTHRIHGAGILMLTWLGYMDGIHVTIYSSTMDPMGYNEDVMEYRDIHKNVIGCNTEYTQDFFKSLVCIWGLTTMWHSKLIGDDQIITIHELWNPFHKPTFKKGPQALGCKHDPLGCAFQLLSRW